MSEKPRILLVDDEPAIVKMVGKRLETEGFEVITAMDGAAALQKAKTEAPQLILLDLMLPKMGGYRVCSLLKKDERYNKIPVILFTARSEERDIQASKEAGANAYITKPFDPQTLLKTIHQLLNP